MEKERGRFLMRRRDFGVEKSRFYSGEFMEYAIIFYRVQPPARWDNSTGDRNNEEKHSMTSVTCQNLLSWLLNPWHAGFVCAHCNCFCWLVDSNH